MFSDPWILVKKKPKPRQVVLVKCYKENPVIKMAYVVRYKNKIEFGAAHDSSYPVDRRRVLDSYPLTNNVVAWRPLPPL